MTFEEWMNNVDHAMEIAVGLSSDCIEDFCYRDCFDSEMDPEDAATAALENAGYNPTVKYFR